MLSDHLEGGKGVEGTLKKEGIYIYIHTYIYIPIADSLCLTAKFNTTW